MFKKQRRNKKELHLSIVTVILWINLCSIVALTAFNYYVFHRKNAKVYQESFISYNLQVTSLAFKNIDQQIIQSALKLPQLYFAPIQENAPILLPRRQSVRDSSRNILSLITELQKVSKSHPCIAGIDLYYEGTDTVVTHFNNVHFPSDEHQRDRYLPWYPVYRSMNLKNSQTSVWTMADVYLMEKPALLYINRISGRNRGEQDIILCACIDPDIFGSYIDLTAGNLLITTRDNQLLYSTGVWEELPLPLPLSSDMTGMREIGDFMVSQYTSPVSGLNYCYAVDSAIFYQDYSSVSHMFLFSFLLSIVFNGIVLFIVSYYNHTAYHTRVQRLTQTTGISMDESEKSFDDSLHTLEREILRLHEAVGSSQGLIFQNAVRAALSGESETDDSIRPWLTRERCCVILISLPQDDVDMLPVEELQADYPPELKFYNVLFATVSGHNLAAVLIFDENSHEQVWTDFVRDMDGRLKDYRLVAGTVDSVRDGGITRSCRCAAEAVRYQYIFTEERYIAYDLLKISHRKNDGSHLKLFEAIRKDVNNSNLFDLRSHIEMLVTSFKSGNYTIDYCQATLRDLVSLLYRIMQQNQLDTWVVFGYDIRAYYKKIENIDRFHTWCDTLCETILKQINQKRQSVDDDLRLKILNLIDEHLESDISLDLLADKLQIRPNTASRVFRQTMGTGYTEYVKSRKLKRAEELILQGYSVKETAEKLGYSTPQYFIKVFKESYGITPYQYKKSQNQENE